MIVNDITYKPVCPIAHPVRVFCDRTTNAIHLNPNMSKLRKYLLDEKLATKEEIKKIEKYECKWHEDNMEAILSHETIHLLLGEIEGWGAAIKFDFVEKKYNLSYS